MEVYHGASARVKPKRTSAPKKSRKFQQADFKAAAISEKRGLSDRTKLLLVALADSVDDKGRGRLTDEAVAEQIGCEPSSVPGLFGGAEELRYLESVGRKRGGERDYQIHSRWLISSDFSVAESEETNQVKETEEVIADSAGERNSEKKKRNYKKTPENVSSRTRVRDSSQESLDSDFSQGGAENPDYLGEQESLDRLRDYYQADHYCYPVQRAAELLGDLPGLPHYRNMLHLTCRDDEKLFAQGLLAMKGRKPAVSERAYLRQTLEGLVEQRAKAKADAEYIAAQDAKHGMAQEAARPAEPRKAASPEAAPCRDPKATRLRELSDEELDALMAQDPFAADPVEHVPDDVPMPDPQVGIEPERPAAPVPSVPVYHQAVQEAIQTLRLTVAEEDVQAVFEGACQGREPLFALVVSAMVGIDVRSPVALMCKIAAEHQGKDDAYLDDRAAGISVAERTQMLKAWEAHLDAEKQALNGGQGCLRTTKDSFAEVLNSIFDGAEAAAGKSDELRLSEFEDLSLPKTSEEKSRREEEYTRWRTHLNRLYDDDRALIEKRAGAFADTKSRLGSIDPKWREWKRVAFFHAFLALHDAKVRTERIQAAREGQEQEPGEWEGLND